MAGTLVDPPRVPACAVCGSTECKQFHNMPYPEHYPFLPGGYDPNAEQTAVEIAPKGKRKAGMQCS